MRLLEAPGLDADLCSKSEAHVAVARAREAELPAALAAAERGVKAASHEGCVGHPDAGVLAPTAAFAVHTLAGVKEAMGDAAATGARDPGAAATALYLAMSSVPCLEQHPSTIRPCRLVALGSWRLCTLQ